MYREWLQAGLATQPELVARPHSGSTACFASKYRFSVNQNCERISKSQIFPSADIEEFESPLLRHLSYPTFSAFSGYRRVRCLAHGIATDRKRLGFRARRPDRGSQPGFSARHWCTTGDAQRRPAAAVARDDQSSQRKEDGAGADYPPVEHRRANRRSLSP